MTQTAEAGNNRAAEPIRVLLVDDHQHVLWGLAKLIDGEWPRMMVIGTARSLQEASAAMRERKPDVVVLDVYLDGENTLDSIPMLLAAAPAEVIVLSGPRDARMAQRAVLAGARAVVDKEAAGETLLREIERVHSQSRTAQPVSTELQDLPATADKGRPQWAGLSTRKERHMNQIFEVTRQFLREEDGVTAIEYGLIAALIAVVIIASVQAVGNNLNEVFNYISTKLNGALLLT